MKPKSRKRKQLADLSVDEFMLEGFDEDGQPGENFDKNIMKKAKKPPIQETISDDETDHDPMDKHKKSGIPLDISASSLKNSDIDEESDSESDLEDPEQHKEALSRLRKNDPEFFNYLSQNDKDLLNFDVSDDEDSADEEKIHKPPSKLEVDSDDSGASGDEQAEDNDDDSSTKVTLSMLKQWTTQLEENPDMEVIRNIVLAFQSAVEYAGDGQRSSDQTFLVEGNSVFNGVVRLCMTSLLPAIHKLLKFPPPVLTQKEGKLLNPTKSKLWPKMMVPMKSYLNCIIKVLTEVFESDLLTLFIRHILYLIPFYIPFVKHSRVLLKKLVHLWSTSEESIRVLSFIGIIRLCRVLPKEYLDYNLKQMYLSYVRNCKFTSSSTWPLINFMKRSLAEIYLLDCSLAYQQSFVYIRQLAIHLRNALTIKKKDAFQAVYNWQYIHCLLLWSHLLGCGNKSAELKPLIYPLTQVTLGTIRLIPTGKYYPLRFQLICALTKLSEETNTFIPVLPLLLEVLQQLNFNKRSVNLSMKPLDISCMLKLSKSQLNESGFKDTCIDKFYELTMDYLNVYAHTIGFPELVLPAVIQMKIFAKKSRVPNYSRKIKQLLEKVEENSQFIKTQRKNVTFGIGDLEKINEWEILLRNTTPLQKYYITWRNIKDRDVVHAIAMKHHVKTRDEKLPTVAKNVKRTEEDGSKEADKTELKELFADADDDVLFTFGSDDEMLKSGSDAD